MSELSYKRAEMLILEMSRTIADLLVINKELADKLDAIEANKEAGK